MSYPIPTAVHQSRLTLYGTTLQLSINTELLLELVIQRELGISIEQNCAVCGPLGGGAKTSLACSLLAISGNNPELAPALKKFQGLVSRNALAHGFVAARDVNKEWFLVTREVREKLTVKARDLDVHFENDVVTALEELQTAAGITDEEIQAYSLEILDLAQAS